VNCVQKRSAGSTGLSRRCDGVRPSVIVNGVGPRARLGRGYPDLRCTSILRTSSGGRLRCLRAWSIIAAVRSLAGSNSESVKPSIHDSRPQLRQWSCARLTFQPRISTRSEPHWQKTSEATAQSRSCGEQKAKLVAELIQRWGYGRSSSARSVARRCRRMSKVPARSPTRRARRSRSRSRTTGAGFNARNPLVR
jgi:hypothetical protein